MADALGASPTSKWRTMYSEQPTIAKSFPYMSHHPRVNTHKLPFARGVALQYVPHIRCDAAQYVLLWRGLVTSRNRQTKCHARGSSATQGFKACPHATCSVPVPATSVCRQFCVAPTPSKAQTRGRTAAMHVQVKVLLAILDEVVDTHFVLAHARGRPNSCVRATTNAKGASFHLSHFTLTHDCPLVCLHVE
jgi:hypothetical protein